MDLLRLPLLPLIEVFKNMDFHEKFLISFLSKRARNTLTVTSEKLHLTFHLSGGLFIDSEPCDYCSRSRVTNKVSDCLIEGNVIRMSIGPIGVISREKSPQKQLLLAKYVLDTFKCSFINIIFYDPTLPSSAWEFMKMINHRQLSVHTLFYYIKSNSSEFIPRILDECTEVIDYVVIYPMFPDDFIYTPPRPFKAREICVTGSANWFNFEDFVSCRRVRFPLNKKSKWTSKSWNIFFRNWLNSDDPLEHMWCFNSYRLNFPQMIKGLSNGRTQRQRRNKWIEVNRKDGSEFVIGKADDHFYIMSKEEHFEYLKST